MLMANLPAKKVLVVEDNELNMKLFCDLLDAYGFETVESRDGLRAMDLAREHKPDLIIMDIQLPEVSGLDLTRWIKDDESIRAIPIMAVTAFAMRADEMHVRDAGCEAYMSKPIQMMPFIDTVRRLTGPRAAAMLPPSSPRTPTGSAGSSGAPPKRRAM
jgi:two-component system cell cycle response regulator DivK